MTSSFHRNPIGRFFYPSGPSGWIIGVSEEGVFSVESVRSVPTLPPLPSSPLREELDRYFQGERTVFGQRLALPRRPEFSFRVWHSLLQIPWGETMTYSHLACMLGGPNLARAVASACSRNPVALLVPCHRVVGKSGPGGYSGEGGVALKLALLRLEGVESPYAGF